MVVAHARRHARQDGWRYRGARHADLSACRVVADHPRRASRPPFRPRRCTARQARRCGREARRPLRAAHDHGSGRGPEGFAGRDGGLGARRVGTSGRRPERVHPGRVPRARADPAHGRRPVLARSSRRTAGLRRAARPGCAGRGPSPGRIARNSWRSPRSARSTGSPMRCERRSGTSMRALPVPGPRTAGPHRQAGRWAVVEVFSNGGFTTRPEISGVFGCAAATHWLAAATAMRILERGGNAFGCRRRRRVRPAGARTASERARRRGADPAVECEGATGSIDMRAGSVARSRDHGGLRRSRPRHGAGNGAPRGLRARVRSAPGWCCCAIMGRCGWPTFWSRRSSMPKAAFR